MISKNQFTEKLAKRIKEVREAKKMSQEELAYQAGLYRTYVGHIYSPSGYVLYKLAKALNVEVSNLLNF